MKLTIKRKGNMNLFCLGIALLLSGVFGIMTYPNQMFFIPIALGSFLAGRYIPLEIFRRFT